jgi:N-acetyl sugar amidotransferase
MYPENARPTIIFDDDGICSGCRYHESRSRVDWAEREKLFAALVEQVKTERERRGNIYDCIVPVSGGKDSNFQVWLMKEKYGLNPLLVAYNHCFNTEGGLRNLENLVMQSGCDLIRYTLNLKSAVKLARYMLKKVGDLTWHYHAGIMTFPIQTAVKYQIPFIFWGEEGFSELTGMFQLDDFVEFKKWTRKEHDMRGFEPEDLVNDPDSDVEWNDVSAFVYPSDEEIAELDLRGIYVSNYFEWDAKKQTELVMREYDFKGVTYKKGRSFVQYSKIDDHANDMHDYLKYLKFGYGRATDETSYEIRHGRMTREEGVAMVEKLDAFEPFAMEEYLKLMDMTREEFFALVEDARDSEIWEKVDGEWVAKDSVVNHVNEEGVEEARVKQSADRTFSEANRQLYYNEDNPPEPTGDPRLDVRKDTFKVL